MLQSFDEPLDGDAGEVAPAEELLPGPPEEPLRGRVVRGTALRAHRPGQLVFPADADPSGPPVMAAAVGVDDRMLPVAERGARVAEHPVGQLGVRARSDHPGDRHPVTVVDHMYLFNGLCAGLSRVCWPCYR